MKETSITDYVYQELRQKIIRGEFEPSERLNEYQLAKELHVSRTPVRQALLTIHHEGLLDYTPHVGYHIRRITEADVREIFALRKALEILATINVSKNLTEENRKQLEGIIKSSITASNKNDLNQMYRYCVAFNKAITELSGMPRLAKIHSHLEDYITLLRNMTFEDNTKRIHLALREHAMIYDAILNQDVELISSLVDKHLERSQATILSALKKMDFFNI